MKQMLKGAALFAAVAAIFASCSKDQQAISKLGGEWWLTSKTVGGTQMIDTTETDLPMYYFETCNIADRNCHGYMTWHQDGVHQMVTRTFTYYIHDDAANLHFYWTPMLGAQQGEVHCDITTQEKDMITFTYTDANGMMVEETLKRGKALEEDGE